MSVNYSITNTTALTATITLSSLATGSTANARQGNYIDFGATRAAQWLAKLQAKPAAAPTAGGSLELWMAWSTGTASTGFPGMVTGIDSAWTAPDGNVAQSKYLLSYVGVLPAVASAVSHTKLVGPFVPVCQYGVPVVVNNWSQALSSTAADHVVVFKSVQDQSA